MKSNRPPRSLFTLAVLTLLFAGPAFAQAPLDPAQLPPRTTLYVMWHGVPTEEVRKANSLLALWDDPDFAPVRSAMFENMMSSSEKDASKPALTREEAQQYSTLPENAFLIGYITKPESKAAAAASPKSTAHSWNGLFFIYDRTGKESLLSKAVIRFRSQEKEPPQISQITIGDVPVLKVERKSGTTYWVEHGKYAVSANERSVLEDLLARLEGKTAVTASLGQSAAYKEAKPMLGGLFEFFAQIPSLKSLAPDPGSSPGLQFGPILDAMKLDAVHSLCGHLVLEGSKTRVQGAILGDAAPGTIFDLWSEGQKSFSSLAFLPASNVISYSGTQFNFLAFYQIVKRAITAAMPPGQQSAASMVDAMAQSRLGMPLPDALGLLSGEFASMQTSPAIDPQKAIYVLGIHKKPEVLKLIRTIFSDQLSSERNEGDTTFLKVSLQGGQGGAGVAQWNFYHLAVTPDYIVGASRSDALHDVLAQRAQSSATALAANPQLQAVRAGYPEKLDGLYYFDFQKVDWPAAKERWTEEAKKSLARQSATSQQKSATVKIPDLLSNANPQVFPRHLHFMAGASWKDATGIHFDEWLE